MRSSSAMDDVIALRASVASLSAEVLRLQTKLDAMHCSDVNGLRYWVEATSLLFNIIGYHHQPNRRAHASLCQHVEALAMDTKSVDDSIAMLDTSAHMRNIMEQEVVPPCVPLPTWSTHR